MIKYLVAVSVISVAAGIPVLAQQPKEPPSSYTLTFSPGEVALVGKGLGKLPFEEVSALLAKIQQQLNAQASEAAPSGPTVKGKR